MTDMERKYQGLVVQGWVGMLVLLLTMFITDLVEFSMRGEYQDLSALLSKDPGITGLWILSALICLNVIAQMSIRSVHRRGCRWRVLWFTVGYAAFFMFHQAAHLLQGDGLDIHFMLDTTHHIVGLWAAWAAYKWARLANAAPNNQMNSGANSAGAPFAPGI